MRRVNCTVLKEEADGLESPPYPGELGQRIFENVSADGWQQWLQRQVLIINENQQHRRPRGYRTARAAHAWVFI